MSECPLTQSPEASASPSTTMAQPTSPPSSFSLLSPRSNTFCMAERSGSQERLTYKASYTSTIPGSSPTSLEPSLDLISSSLGVPLTKQSRIVRKMDCLMSSAPRLSLQPPREWLRRNAGSPPGLPPRKAIWTASQPISLFGITEPSKKSPRISCGSPPISTADLVDFGCTDLQE